jgi:O-antigen/teichoic acid export membrane protein
VALLTAVVLLVRAERRHRGARRPAAPSRAERRNFWAFSAPRAVSAAAEICLEWADVLIVGALCSPAEAGVYAVVTRAARSAELVQQASRIAVGPVLAAALAQGRLGTVRRLHQDVAVGTAVLSWPFFVIAAYFAPSVLSLFGPGFAAGATALRILCLGLALSYAAGGVQSILLMGGRSTAQLGNKVACLIVNVGLDLALVPRFGIVGAAIAWAVVLILDAALAWLQILLGLRLRLALRPAYVAGAAAAAAAAGVCRVTDTLGVGLSAGVLQRGTGSLGPLVAATLVVGAAGGAVATVALRSRALVGRGDDRNRDGAPAPAPPSTIRRRAGPVRHPSRQRQTEHI